jgi:hypothetical protein
MVRGKRYKIGWLTNHLRGAERNRGFFGKYHQTIFCGSKIIPEYAFSGPSILALSLKVIIEMNEVVIKFTPEERDLIIDHTFAGPDLTKRLQIAEIKGKHLITKYSTYDLEELIGFIAAEANHTDDKKIGKKLDRLFERLSDILDNSIEYHDDDE